VKLSYDARRKLTPFAALFNSSLGKLPYPRTSVSFSEKEFELRIKDEHADIWAERELVHSVLDFITLWVILKLFLFILLFHHGERGGFHGGFHGDFHGDFHGGLFRRKVISLSVKVSVASVAYPRQE
jgi:hypothetical protein